LNPAAVALDSSGNVIVADQGNHRIRKITPEGVVSTLAGSGERGANNGSLLNATFGYPYVVAVDRNNNIFVVETQSANIRIITCGSAATNTQNAALPVPGALNTTTRSNDCMVSTFAMNFSKPKGITINSLNNIYYVADTNSQRIRMIKPGGFMSTLAGSGSQGFADGRGTAASFSYPYGMAVDTGGNIIVADTGNNCIRKVTPWGAVTTLAGSGSAAFADGTGTAASFNGPTSVAVNVGGNVIVADQSNNRIRMITPVGVVTTLAGSGQASFADGTGTGASFKHPSGVAVDTGGNVIVADQYNNRIRKITPEGNVTTLAGSGAEEMIDGAGTSASFNLPEVVAVDTNNNVIVTGVSGIRKITPGGIVTTITANGSSAYGSHSIAVDANNNIYLVNEEGIRIITCGSAPTPPPLTTALPTPPLTTALPTPPIPPTTPSNDCVVTTFAVNGVSKLFNSPNKVVLDTAENIYIADSENHNIKKITPDGTITILAGLNTDRILPTSIAIDSNNNWYISDSYNHHIKKITPAGIMTIFAGSTDGFAAGFTNGFADGVGTAARFKQPRGLIIDASSNVIVADQGNCCIRKITPEGVVTTLAGSTEGFADGMGTAARFNQPADVAIDLNGNIIVADQNNNRIRKITPGGAVTTLAGSGAEALADGTGTGASFRGPGGVAVDASGNVIVADSVNNCIRKITPESIVTTLAGRETSWPFSDGTGPAASFNYPCGIAVDAGGNVFVGDIYNRRIRKVTPGGVVTTIAGNGSYDFADGTGAAASFSIPSSLDIDVNNNIYVADYTNGIRKVTLQGVVTSFLKSDGFADGTGSVARFNYPTGIAIDASNNLIVADNNNHSIRKITPGGVVTTIAGRIIGNQGGFRNDTGTNAMFKNPFDVAIDANNNVIVADYSNHCIRKITPGGVVSTLAGAVGVPAFTDGTGSVARFSSPCSVAVDANNNVIVADQGNHRIRKITSEGVVTTLAGNGIIGIELNSIILPQPRSVAMDASGNIIVGSGLCIKKVTPTGVVTTITREPCYIPRQTPLDIDGPMSSASFSIINSVAIDSSNNIYVTTSNGCLRKITCGASAVINTAPVPVVNTTTLPPQIPTATPSNECVVSTIPVSGLSANVRGGFVEGDYNDSDIYIVDSNRIYKVAQNGVKTLLAGSGAIGLTDGIGTAASFNNPSKIVGNYHNLYVSDGNRIRKITRVGGVVTTLAGGGGVGWNGSGYADGIGSAAAFSNPQGLTIDEQGNIYVADICNNRIRVVTQNGVVTTLAGGAGGVQGGTIDGTGSAAGFNGPIDIAIFYSPTKQLAVLEMFGASIRKVTPEGVVTTFVGNSPPMFNFPTSIAMDYMTNIYVAEEGRIRKVRPDGVVSTLAGNNSGTLGYLDGPCNTALFRRPNNIIQPTRSEYLYVFDAPDWQASQQGQVSKIRKIYLALPPNNA